MSDKRKAFSFQARQQGKSWLQTLNMMGGHKHGRDRTADSPLHGSADQEPGDGAGAGDTYTQTCRAVQAYNASITAAPQDARARQLAVAQAHAVYRFQAHYAAMTRAALFGTSVTHFGVDHAAPEPPEVPNDGIRVGEIIAWRFWRVELDWRDRLRIVSPYVPTDAPTTPLPLPRRPEPRLQSAIMDNIWRPGEVMEGEPDVWNADQGRVGRKGVNGHKARRDAEEHAQMFLASPRFQMNAASWGIKEIPESPVAIGAVALWGDVIEHEHGYRAQYGKINSLDAVLDHAGNGDGLLDELRRIYGVAGEGG